MNKSITWYVLNTMSDINVIITIHEVAKYAVKYDLYYVISEFRQDNGYILVKEKDKYITDSTPYLYGTIHSLK